jgi:hypothetical protein
MTSSPILPTLTATAISIYQAIFSLHLIRQECNVCQNTATAQGMVQLNSKHYTYTLDKIQLSPYSAQNNTLEKIHFFPKLSNFSNCHSLLQIKSDSSDTEAWLCKSMIGHRERKLQLTLLPTLPFKTSQMLLYGKLHNWTQFLASLPAWKLFETISMETICIQAVLAIASFQLVTNICILAWWIEME